MKILFVKRALMVAVLATGFVAVQPALADDHGHDRGRSQIVRHDPGWDRHERDAHMWHRHHPVYAPGVVYAPPAVVYAPPPPPPGINLIIPFNIR